MPELDFEQIFSEFSTGSNNSSAIRDIYDIVPTLELSQIKVITSLSYFIEKYNLPELETFVNTYLRQMDKNKSMNFSSSMNVKALLKAYTQEELIKGIKLNSLQNKDGGL